MTKENEISETRDIVNGIDMAELERILEFGVVLFFGWIVANYIHDLLLASFNDPSTTAIGQALAFFATLLIYYKLIRVHIKISR